MAARVECVCQPSFLLRLLTSTPLSLLNRLISLALFVTFGRRETPASLLCFAGLGELFADFFDMCFSLVIRQGRFGPVTDQSPDVRAKKAT